MIPTLAFWGPHNGFVAGIKAKETAEYIQTLFRPTV